MRTGRSTCLAIALVLLASSAGAQDQRHLEGSQAAAEAAQDPAASAQLQQGTKGQLPQAAGVQVVGSLSQAATSTGAAEAAMAAAAALDARLRAAEALKSLQIGAAAGTGTEAAAEAGAAGTAADTGGQAVGSAQVATATIAGVATTGTVTGTSSSTGRGSVAATKGRTAVIAGSTSGGTTVRAGGTAVTAVGTAGSAGMSFIAGEEEDYDAEFEREEAERAARRHKRAADVEAQTWDVDEGAAAAAATVDAAAAAAGPGGGYAGSKSHMLFSERMVWKPEDESWDEVPEFNLSRAEALARTDAAGHFVLNPNTTGRNIPLKWSSFECVGTEFQQRVCTFYNLVLWNGTLHYISDERTLIPDVCMTYIAVEPFSIKTNLSAQLNVSSPAKMGVLLGKDNFTWGDVPKVFINESLFVYLSYHNNYGHLLGEMGPIIHNLLCTYMGHCTAPVRGQPTPQLLLYNRQPNVTHIMPRAAREELWPCFTHYPLLRANDGRLNHTAVVFGKLVAGIGATCRGFPWCRPRYNRSGPPRNMALQWKQRLHQCVGLPELRRANHTHPNVVVINRPLAHGRGFVNMPAIARRLRADFRNMTLRVVELDEDSLAAQAKTYTGADVLIQMHGAALGNVIFLPLGAVYIDVVPENNDDKHAWAYFMLKDYATLQINPIALPPQRAELMERVIKMMPHWKLLTPQQKRNVMVDHICPKPGAVPFNEYQICVIEWFMKRSNSYLDYTQLSTAMSQALQHMSVWAHRLYNNYTVSAIDISEMRPERDLIDVI